MGELTYQKRSEQSTRMVAGQRRAKDERVLEDNRAAFAAKQLKQNEPAQLEQQTPAKPNNTGLPDKLKSGIENLSGVSMDSVKVHYNSSQPAQLNALAYAQGTDIHLAPGQEQHLPHEAWHVVQQAQGRVKPTMQMKGVAINNDEVLEREADLMGGKAVQMRGGQKIRHPPITHSNQTQLKKYSSDEVSQRIGGVSQLLRYRRLQPIEGVTMRLAIEHNGNRLNIVDLTQSDKPVGNLRGYIEYKIGGQPNEVSLEHFEAHPAGAGLGTLLMYELSLIALAKNIEIISVSSPALSAMGAYSAFGGIPRDQAQHEQYKQMYLDAMNQEPERHKDFVNQEANEVAESQVAREKYFNPSLGPVGAANLFIGARGDHRNAHSTVEDRHRVADMWALSSQLIYIAPKLNVRMLNNLMNRWDII